MKTLLSIFAFAMTLITSAQYHALISEDKVWKGITYGWGEFPFYQRILGDSLINDVVYSKVWNAQTLVGDQYNIGLIREDVEQQKVYLWNGITEALLYDFSAESGDVVLCSGVGGEQSITITTTESILVNGELHKKLNFQDAWTSAFWIEGIGSGYGIMDAAIGMVTDYGPTLNCFYEEEQLVWSSENSPEICALTLGQKENEISKFNLWPNPTLGEITITTDHFAEGNYEVSVISSLGKEVYYDRMLMRGTKKLDLSNLSGGLYTVVLLLDRTPVASVRVIKE